MSFTACTLLALAAFVPAEPPKAQPQRAKWEYKGVDFEHDLRGRGFDAKERKKTIDAMNKLGEEGWECISIANALIGLKSANLDGPSRAYYKMAKDAAARKVWEYSVVEMRFAPRKGKLPLILSGVLPGSDESQLKELEEDGWELACTVRPLVQVGLSSWEQEPLLYLLKRSK